MVAEIDKPHWLLSVVMPIVLLASVGIVAVALWQWSTFAVERELERKVLTKPSPQLLALRAREQAQLHRYQWLDGKHQTLRIPVERALELVLAERNDAAHAVTPGSTP